MFSVTSDYSLRRSSSFLVKWLLPLSRLGSHHNFQSPLYIVFQMSTRASQIINPMLNLPRTAEFWNWSCKLGPHSGVPLVLCVFLQSRGLHLFLLESIIVPRALPGHKHRILVHWINEQVNYIYSITEGLALSSIRVFPNVKTGWKEEVRWRSILWWRVEGRENEKTSGFSTFLFLRFR